MAPLKNLLPLHKKDAENSTAAPSIPTTASIEPKEGHEHAPHNGHDYRPQSDHSHNPRSEHSRRHHYRDNARARKNALSKWMSNKWRNELVATVAEFCGTYMFLFFAFGGTQVANTAALYADASVAGQDNNSLTQAPNTSVLLYISLIFGFSLMVTVWVFFRVSGGLFNPAVSSLLTPVPKE
jgi:aquaporin related protein